MYIQQFPYDESSTDSMSELGTDSDGDFEMFRPDDFSAVDQYGCVVYDLTSRNAEAFMEDV